MAVVSYTPVAQSADIPAWIAFFLGLYSLASGVGEMRNPGGWVAMMADFERSPAARFVTGFACIAVGAAIYLTCPWRAGDWLAILVNILGGVAVGEGMLILAAGDRFVAAARRLLGNTMGFWAAFSVLFGLAAVIAAVTRL
ncbi:MAG TPA: hypothetical protein VIC34_01285 [Croceibacterium sp.]